MYEIDMKYINDEFVSDIQSDIDLLKEIRKEWFGAENIIKLDPKLDSFKRILRQKLENDPKRKLVVFTEFADTADYLGDKLIAAGLPVFKYTSADASASNKDIIDTNFNAGLKVSIQKDDYKIFRVEKNEKGTIVTAICKKCKKIIKMHTNPFFSNHHFHEDCLKMKSAKNEKRKDGIRKNKQFFNRKI